MATEKIKLLFETCVLLYFFRHRREQEGNLCHQQFSEKFSSEFDKNRDRIVT